MNIEVYGEIRPLYTATHHDSFGLNLMQHPPPSLSPPPPPLLTLPSGTRSRFLPLCERCLAPARGSKRCTGSMVAVSREEQRHIFTRFDPCAFAICLIVPPPSSFYSSPSTSSPPPPLTPRPDQCLLTKLVCNLLICEQL